MGSLVRSCPWRALVLVLALAACGRPAPEQTIDQAVASPRQPGEAVTPVVVCLGDSLTAGLGLLAEQAYPHVLEQMFAYFDYGDLPFIQQDEQSDYDRAA